MTAKDSKEPDPNKVDARKVDKDPTSTWGATEEAKQTWESAHGEKTRKANAKRDRDSGAES